LRFALSCDVVIRNQPVIRRRHGGDRQRFRQRQVDPAFDSGQGFDPSGQAPKVTFNTSNLTVISFSNSSIVAALPTGTKSGSIS